MNWNSLLEPNRLALLIPILAMVGWMFSAYLKHRERMAMIERGLLPAADDVSKQERQAERR